MVLASSLVGWIIPLWYASSWFRLCCAGDAAQLCLTRELAGKPEEPELRGLCLGRALEAQGRWCAACDAWGRSPGFGHGNEAP